MIPVIQEPDVDDWTLAGDVAETLVTDIANKAKDAVDTKLDAQRITSGMTLDEYLAR
jgi:hypothetical protein